jgi:hypothetical protein
MRVPPARISHLANDLVDRLAEVQAAEQSIHRVVGFLPYQNAPITKLELHDSPCRQSELFPQLERNRELPAGGNRALHREQSVSGPTAMVGPDDELKGESVGRPRYSAAPGWPILAFAAALSLVFFWTATAANALSTNDMA